MSRAAGVVSVLLIGLTGCWELLPASKDSLRDAAHHERGACVPDQAPYPPELLSPTSVLSVAPLYFLRSEHGNQASHLLGATLVLRPLGNLSSEALERLLICHSARSALSRAGEPTVPNDPYWVPGHPIRISVEFAEGATTVRLEGRDFDGAKAILERAEAFAAAGGLNRAD